MLCDSRLAVISAVEGNPYGRPGRLFMNDCSKAVFRRCAQTRRAWFTLSPMEIVSRFLLLGLIRR